MTLFVLVSTVLTLVVLGTVLSPLWRQSRGATIGAVLALGLSTLALYNIVGTPAGITHAVAQASPRDMQQAIVQLEAELARDPNQPEGWQLLARSYAMIERPEDARDAYGRAAKLLPDNPDILVEAAQARLFTNPKKLFDAESVAMLQHALALQPQHQRARWFVGVWQRQNGHAAEAAQTWEPLLAQVDESTAATLRVQINAARQDAGQPALASAPTPPAAAGANALTVKVALDPDFAARMRLRGDASVFVIARVPDGPPMPVAVEKHRLQDLPLTVMLDDGDSPMPTQKLSALKEVELIARLSASGNPMHQDGDIESKPLRITLPAKSEVTLTLGSD